MSEQTTKDEKRVEAVAKQYRDMLIPSTLFAGLALTNLLFIFSQSPLSSHLVWSGICALACIVIFTTNLLYCTECLNAIEINGKQLSPEEGGGFAAEFLGILLFLTSLILLSFWKSYTLGVAAIIVCVLGIIFLVVLIRDRGIKF
jgi:hypothetical protein